MAVATECEQIASNRCDMKQVGGIAIMSFYFWFDGECNDLRSI